MKLFVFLILFPCFVFGQKESLNTKAEFEKLFGGYWDASNQEIIWKPDFEESLFFSPINNSEDGKCYTKVTKELVYKNELYFIFATYFKGEMVNDCHFCGAPLSIAKYKFSEHSKKWEISVFDKYVTTSGFYGSPNDFEIMEIGNHCFIKEISIGDYNMGYYADVISFFNEWQGEFRMVFSYTKKEGNNFIPEEEGYENTTTFLIDNHQKVVLETAGMRLEGGEQKVNLISAKKRLVYHISPKGEFILQCE